MDAIKKIVAKVKLKASKENLSSAGGSQSSLEVKSVVLASLDELKVELKREVDTGTYKFGNK